MSKQQPILPDHDVLITLSANFDTFTKQYQIDIRELKDGTTKQIADHEIRIHKLESVMNEVKPIETVAEFRALQKQVNDYVVSARTARWFLGFFTAIAGSALTLVLNYLIRTFFGIS